MTFAMTARVDTLEAALAPVSALVDECKVRFDEDGISIRAVDPANVAMVDMTLDEAGLESLVADEGVIGVDLDRLEDVIGMGGSDDLVSLELDAETRKLHIQIDDLSYTLALIDPDSIRQEPDIPDLELPATAAMEGQHLLRGFSAADLVADRVRIRGDPGAEAVVIAAEGDTDDVELTLGADELVSADVPEAADSLFSLNYLTDMGVPIPDDVIVTLRFGTEFPIKARYQAADYVSVENMLAPRVESS
jgi:proliferating cell nuclear antigen